MIITCVSTSNTKLLGEKSTSTKVCNMVGDIIKREYKENVEVKTVPLMDYEFKPCILCGECAKTNNCVYDEDFNKLLLQLGQSDGIIFVVPHYSPIPAKLIMVFEKINEIMYSGWVKDQKFRAPITKKPVGIIGHGGVVESDKILKYYHEDLITPVAIALKSLSFDIVEFNDEFKYGVPFGLIGDNCYEEVAGEVFPRINHDFEHIEKRITPFVKKFADRIITK